MHKIQSVETGFNQSIVATIYNDSLGKLVPNFIFQLDFGLKLYFSVTFFSSSFFRK